VPHSLSIYFFWEDRNFWLKESKHEIQVGVFLRMRLLSKKRIDLPSSAPIKLKIQKNCIIYHFYGQTFGFSCLDLKQKQWAMFHFET
jgi:hypothetical protein